MRNSKSPRHIDPLTIADFEHLFPDDDACAVSYFAPAQTVV